MIIENRDQLCTSQILNSVILELLILKVKHSPIYKVFFTQKKKLYRNVVANGIKGALQIVFQPGAML